MLIDHRTYRIFPGRVPAQLDLYSKLAYPVQLRYMGEPHYYLVSESGQLNTLVHGWIYERRRPRAKTRQDDAGFGLEAFSVGERGKPEMSLSSPTG